eukprot:c22594_g1_i1 orf=61-1596(+)
MGVVPAPAWTPLWEERAAAAVNGTGKIAHVLTLEEGLEDVAKKSKARMMVKAKGRKGKGWTQRIVRKACQWGPLVLPLALMSLLILEVCHLFRDHLSHSPQPGERQNTEHPFQHKTTDEESRVIEQGATHKESNLNRLDMPTRIVRGVREPCLKLLPWEEISDLDFPPSPTGPLKILHYKMCKSHLLEEHLPVSFRSQNIQYHERELKRDLLFTGNQTMDERDQSYKVSEVMQVHCGFCSGGNTFEIGPQDKALLDKCKAVVMTCAFGGGDDIYQPINVTKASFSKVCFVAFWDEVTLEAQMRGGRQPDSSGKIGHWHIVVVRNLPFSDQRLNGKIPKMLGHRLFPNARYSIWVDSKSQFRRDPMAVFEALLWRTNSSLAISEHGARDCVYKEGDAIVRKHKASPEEVATQLGQYRREGFPEKARFDDHKALAEASIIVREHMLLTNLFMCLWFNEVTRFTARDQLSFPYVLKRLGVLHINMFPVCTRKSLVNSLGHMHKAKPLNISILSS